MPANVMDWIEVGGSAIRYVLRPGSGHTVVLVHEMGGTLESWDDVVARLPQSWRILRYDVRGSGLSEKLIAACNIDTHVDDLAGLLGALGIQGPIALTGGAVGAAVCIQFASRHPALVSHVLALAPACGTDVDKQAGVLAVAGKIATEGMRPTAATFFESAWPQALRTDPHRYASYRARWLANDSRGIAAALEMLATVDLSGAMAHTPRRTLIVGGTFDPLRPPVEIQRLALLAPLAEAVLVPSGHFMSVQSPKLVASLIEGFVASETSAGVLLEEFLADPANVCGAWGHAT